jgi:predicted nucleic acid-binding protein
MTTAVDTNILFDLVAPDSEHYELSSQALAERSNSEPLIISEAVYAEIAPLFSDQQDLERFLSDLTVSLERTSRRALHLAGLTWREYLRRRTGFTCRSCGRRQSVDCGNCGATISTRQHLITDFLIGAHAHVHAGRLLTRDRGYYARYFPDLNLV